jgi:predicted permease
MFRTLANRVIQWTISPRIEQMPDEARRRYFRNMAWFCFVLALSEALFAFLILWAWLTIVWVAPVLPAIWLAVGAVLLFFVAAVTFTAARIARERAKNTR